MIFFYKKTILKQNFLTKTLTEEFKPVALQNCEIKNRQNNNISWTPPHFWLFKIPNYETKAKIAQSKSHRKLQHLAARFQSLRARG